MPGRKDGARILVADDDHLVRLVVRRVLEHAGHEVVEADAVQAAVAFSEDPSVALAVVDAHMPGGDLAAMLGGLRAHRALPVLVISGDAEAPPEVVAPAMAFLTKPLSLEDLTRAVGALLGATAR